MAGCGAKSTGALGKPVPRTVRVSSPAFAAGALIPVKYTCDGRQLSPPLAWTGVPKAATSQALVVDDPDGPGGTYVHWILLDIPVGTRHLPAGQVPRGAVQALGSGGHDRYDGPCPPAGTHHDRFTVYALRYPTGLPQGAATAKALHAVQQREIASGRLVGRYHR